MPRDGSGVYHTPAGTDAVTDTTISSSAYNANVHDVESDLNTARPIVAGGTGGTSASSARTNLQTEARLQPISDYNAATFEAGSFFSATSAANSPVAGHAFSGICYQTDASNMFLEARDATTGINYTRQMTTGAWGAWTADPGTNAVRYDTAQTLTTDTGTTMGQRSQARSNIYAAPFDALAYNGMQMNGSMEVSQENGTTGIGGLTTQKYICDGWQVAVSGPTVSANISATSLAGYTSQLGFSVTTATPSPAAGNFAVIQQRIEGYRVARLAWGTANAQPISIAFWVYAARPGTYSGSLANGANNRSYPFSFTITASTWEYKTVTIPGDTAGTWTKDNTSGLFINFTAMCGTTYAGPANAWAGTFYLGVTGTTNGTAATTDIFVITGVVILPGIELPSAARAPFIMRPFDQELATCRRYFEWLGTGLPIVGASATAVNGTARYAVQKRATATLSLTRTNPGIFGCGPGTFQNGVGSTISIPGTSDTDGVFFQITGFTGLTTNVPGMTNDSYNIKVDARL
jgi:hypothetical protein